MANLLWNGLDSWGTIFILVPFLLFANVIVAGLNTRVGKAFLPPYPASYGTFAHWCIWLAWYTIIILYSMGQGYTSRRIKSRRRAVFGYYLPISCGFRVIVTIGWLITLGFIEHGLYHVISTLASLFDLALLGLALIVFWIDETTSMEREVVVAAPNKQQAAGCISSEKATQIIDARQRQYGPALRQLMQQNDLVECHRNLQNSSPKVIYASVETYPTEAEPDTPSGSHGSMPGINGYPGFLRCGCCENVKLTVLEDGEHDVESAPAGESYSEWNDARSNFLQNESISGSLGYMPGLGEDPYEAHSLCPTCTLLCARICSHRLKHDEKQKQFVTNIISNIYPEQQLISLQHHKTPLELNMSATRCHLCALIWGCLKDEQQRKNNEGIFLRILVFENILVPHYGGFNRPKRWQPVIRRYQDISPEPGSEFARPIFLKSPKDSHASGPIVLPVSGSTGSKTTFSLIKQVVSLRAGKTDFIPTRLIDLKQYKNGRFSICNHSRLGYIDDRRYIALSHCWGDPNTMKIKLEQHNERLLYQGLDISLLGKTFQEAIQVTWNLGIRFLWIDSLCIIQGSAEDWTIEANRMADIYRNAVCTIAAIASWDSTEGLFRSQNPLASTPCFMGCVKNSPVYAVPCSQPAEIVRQTDVSLTQWSNRGWCLQEQYLSETIIYFGERQIFISLGNPILKMNIDQRPTGTSRIHNHSTDNLLGPATRDRTVNEDVGSSTEKPFVLPCRSQLDTTDIWQSEEISSSDDDTEENIHGLANFVIDHAGQNSKGDWHHVWWALVNEYSRRLLTNSNDKLVAISGLAIAIRDQYPSIDRQCIYAAGLWEQELTSGLLWYVDLKRSHKRPQPYRAPSWSWASVDGVVFNDSLHMSISKAARDFKILSIHFPKKFSLRRMHTSDWLIDKPIDGAHIMVRGIKRVAQWRKTTEETSYRYYVARNLIRHDRKEMEQDESLPWLFSAVSTTPEVGPLCHELLHPETGSRIGWFLPDTSEWFETNMEHHLSKTLVCLKIEVAPNETTDPTQTWAIRGLALQQVESHGAQIDVAVPCYRRIGYFELNCKHKGIDVDEVQDGFRSVKYTPHTTDQIPNMIEFATRHKPELDPQGFFDAGSGLEDMMII